MSTDYDYSDHMPAPSDDALAKLNELVHLQMHAANRVAELETLLAQAKAEHEELKNKTVPDYMVNTLGLKIAKTADGLTVKIKDVVRASLPKDERREKAFDWLVQKGHAGLIKELFTIQFGREEYGWAEEFAKQLAETQPNLDLVRKKDIHNQTLCAFLREQLKEGTDVPLDLFGAWQGKAAEVSIK